MTLNLCRLSHRQNETKGIYAGDRKEEVHPEVRIGNQEIKQKSQMFPLTLPCPATHTAQKDRDVRSSLVGLWSLSPLPPRRQLILVKQAVARREVYLFLFIIGSFLNPVEP